MQVGILEKINAIYEKLDAIELAGKLFSPETVAAFQELDDLNINLIVEDFKKGNYLGNRKIDIDLSLNNTSTTSVPTYQKVNIILIDGTNLEMPFDNGSGGVLELSSHGDIKNFIVNHNLFTQIEDTEIVLLEAFADTPAMIRFRDADGKASNIERIELFVYTGTVVSQKVSYYWALTTSALQTLANRVGDIIKIGNNFDPMILLSNKADELVIMQTKINELMTIYSNLNTILSSKNDALAASESATFAFQNSKKAEDSAVLASQKAESASGSASMAAEKLSKIQSITVQGQTLAAGQNVSVSYNPITNKFTFSIPQGEKGDRGESFRVNSIGTIAGRALYDNELANFSYLASDVEIEGSIIPHIYFKKSNTAGDWTTGIPFGRGEKGDKGDAGVGISSILRTDGVGSAGQTDVYTITLTDGNTHQFSVYNGKDTDINLSDLTTLSNVMQNSLNQKINISDIKDSLTSTDTTKPLSANQGKVLKELIDNINTIITSDDTTLDQMQEVVNFIKQNKTDLQNLDLSNIAETTTLKHFTATLLTKLNGIAANANNYSHPSSHSASMITESTTRRFVSDSEKESWNGKADSTLVNKAKGNLGIQEAFSNSFQLNPTHAGKLLCCVGGISITLPTINSIESGNLFIIRNDGIDEIPLFLNNNSTSLQVNTITGGETIVLQSDGGRHYREVSRTSKTPAYEDSATIMAYNTVHRATCDITVDVICTGSYMNGIQLIVGKTITPTRVLHRFSDDINANTKSISFSAVIPAGMYWKVEPFGSYSYEQIEITAYKHK